MQEYSPEFEVDEMHSQMLTDKFDSSKSDNLKPGNNTPIVSSAEENITHDKMEIKQSSNASSNSSRKCDSKTLQDTLEEQFGDELFLQDYVVEIHQVRLKTRMLFS